MEQKSQLEEYSHGVSVVERNCSVRELAVSQKAQVIAGEHDHLVDLSMEM